MGEQRKKFNGWRLSIFSVLLMLTFFLSAVGFQLINLSERVRSHLVVAGSQDFYWNGNGASGNASGGFTNTQNGKVQDVVGESELASMAVAIKDSGRESSLDLLAGVTFNLKGEFDLGNPGANLNVAINPYWEPIDIGNYGKNHNINIKGEVNADGKITTKIKGMHIKYCEDDGAKCDFGFFAHMVGGSVENIVFENPVIEYEYHQDSIADNVATRPSEPIDVCLGVIAGRADSTYFRNVEIINPIIKFTSENTNAHNFCVGSAVGKLSFTRETKTTSLNTNNQWGLDKVSVYTEGVNESEIRVEIQKGNKAGVTYGNATSAYIGGMVGANISSKLVNCSLQSLSVNPVIANDVAGTYYVGGMVGLTTQFAKSEDTIVAAGLFNNFIKNITLANVDAENRYCGNLVGRIHSASYVYNNIVLGVTSGYDRLWKNIANTTVIIDKEGKDTSNCVGHHLGGINQYYFEENTAHNLNHIANTGCIADGLNSDYPYCSTHQERKTLSSTKVKYSGSDGVSGEYEFNAANDMAQHNYMFATVNGDYNTFMATTYTKMSSPDIADDSLFHVSLPIMYFEKGITVDDSEGDQYVYDQMLQAINQFCNWSSNDLGFGKYFGEEISVTFNANTHKSENDVQVTSNGYFEEFSNRKDTLVEPYSAQKKLTPPHINPLCDGYRIIGWKLKGLDNTTKNQIEQPGADAELKALYNDNKQYLDEDLYYFKYHLDEHGYWVCEKTQNSDGVAEVERITQEREFVAIWEIQQFKVSYFLAENEPYIPENREEQLTELVTYGYTLTEEPQPTKPGYSFAGWYTKENPDPAVDKGYKWNYASAQVSGTKMPGKDVSLYAGWIDKFSQVRDILTDAKYQRYAALSNQYFTDTTGASYNTAFENAKSLEIAIADPNQNVSNNDVEVVLNNLNSAIAALRVDPQKLLNLNAYNSAKDENRYPFLYKQVSENDDGAGYDNYQKTKDVILNWINSGATDDELKDIDGFESYYNSLEELFIGLKYQIKSDFQDEEDVTKISATTQALIKKYEDLEKTYQQMQAEDKLSMYDRDSTAELFSAADTARKVMTTASNAVLANVQSVLNTYSSAISPENLKLADENGANNNQSNQTKKSEGASKLPFSPIALGAAIVAVLAVATYGFITVDFVLNKRRLAKQKANTPTVGKQQTEAAHDDDDTYI